MGERKKISHGTEKLLWALSAGRCEKCGRLIYRHPLSYVIGNFAQIAHNLPVGDNGPRSEHKAFYKSIDETIDIDSVQNLLLLCYDCHKEIDEINPKQYTPNLLKTMKLDFEEYILKATNNERIKPTIAIKYSPNLHGKKLQVTGIQKALFPDKVIYKEVDLTLKNSTFFVGDPQFWSIEESNLTRSFNQSIIPLVDDYRNGIPNISVFAIAPIPLLVKLGTLLSNKQCVDVYQLKKAPESSWEWETELSDTNYKVNYIQDGKFAEKIILILSLSGKIRHEEVKEIVSWEKAIVVEVTTDNEPFDDYLRHKIQLEKFVRCYQRLKEELRNKSETNINIHLFAAIPVSIAVEIGRYRNETFDLPLILYNYTDGKYEKALLIGGANEN